MNKSDSLKLIYWGTAGCASRAVSNFITGVNVKDLMFKHNEIGYNYRLNNIQAALGLSQLKRINKKD